MPLRVHTFQAGDTISGIAAQYGFGSQWQPILNLNLYKEILKTKEEANRIPIGKSILVPRTPEEYDETIKGLKDLQIEVDRDMKQSLKELDGYKAEADVVGTRVDIAADIAFAARGAFSASLRLGPRYAKYIMRKEVLNAAVGVADKVMALGVDDESRLIIKNAGQAAVDQSVMTQAKRLFDNQKHRQQFATGMAKSLAKKGAVTSAKVVAPVEIANGVGDIVDVLCDVAIGAGKGLRSAVEAVAPSKLAKGFVWIQSGEHPDDTHARIKRFVASTNKNSAERLQKTVAKLKEEKKAVYGSV